MQKGFVHISFNMATAEADKRKTSCPWGKLPQATPVPCSFSSLMDEEYAKQVEKEQAMQTPLLGGDVKVELLTEGKIFYGQLSSCGKSLKIA